MYPDKAGAECNQLQAVISCELIGMRATTALLCRRIICPRKLNCSVCDCGTPRTNSYGDEYRTLIEKSKLFVLQSATFSAFGTSQPARANKLIQRTMLENLIMRE